VKVFVKQMGTVWAKEHGLYQVDRKGHDMAEWPADLQIREVPRGWIG